ncbi:MAG TPA: TlpA disulfide reductase family protein [Candidatus Polarisedimenticolaceae bacterium]|nr:TlpA disulfide reductase family protein [Candidatus Polarisedimenticolaceae bacterium]
MKAPLAALALFLAAVVSSERLTTPLTFEDAAGAKVILNEPGMLYLVDFWAEGCKPCMEEMPELERLANKYEPTGRFKLISVLWGGWKGQQLKDFAKRYDIQRGFYSDPENWLMRIDDKVFPTKLLIRDGEILYRTHGGGTGAYAKWSKVVEAELKDR